MSMNFLNESLTLSRIPTPRTHILPSSYRFFLSSIHRTTDRNSTATMMAPNRPSRTAPTPDDMPYQCNFWFFMICGCRDRKTKVLFASCGGRGTPGSEETQRSSTVSSRDTLRSTWNLSWRLRDTKPMMSGSVLSDSPRYFAGACNKDEMEGQLRLAIYLLF